MRRFFGFSIKGEIDLFQILFGFVSDCCVNQLDDLPSETIDSRFHLIEQSI